jgi:hypothetical protein
MKFLLSFSGGYGSFSHDHPWLSILFFVVISLVGGLLVLYWQNKD